MFLFHFQLQASTACHCAFRMYKSKQNCLGCNYVKKRGCYEICIQTFALLLFEMTMYSQFLLMALSEN